MDNWRPHWLEASGDLAPWRMAITSEIERAHGALSRVMTPPRLDILLQRREGETIPEVGMVGFAFHGALFSMVFDPDNPNFETSLGDGAVTRQVLHEVHHCLRMGGPGYGRTLGECMVSEGLAGQFVRHLLGTPPEPWEQAVPPETFAALWPDADLLGSTRFDHGAWFLGAGAYPRWLVYSMGYWLVGRWLEAIGAVDIETWITVSADAVLAHRPDESAETSPLTP
ncbi:MAG: DUF2268 domain-containing protein [Rhodospirillum sp.]|nr:DUF2268 domain-containing protein [Rhodospirillum sp.]MCF8487680.1 DUF2268 domain-containing protein [Rhodospirillum sp.]MCF8499576.1 DUF2268 domain-containing protein [Rhodospirillum sp.]